MGLGLVSGYLRLPAGLSGGRRLARGAARWGQEGLGLCAGRARLRRPYPSSPLPWGQAAWGHRAEVGALPRPLSLQRALTWGVGCAHSWGPKREGLAGPKVSLAKRGLSPPWEKGDALGRSHRQRWGTLPPSTLGWWHKTRPACLSWGEEGGVGRGGEVRAPFLYSGPFQSWRWGGGVSNGM